MATAYTNNWVHDNNAPSEASRRTLEKVKKMEKEKIKEGWRWIKLNQRTRFLVPCDKKGEPTEDGRRMMSEILERISL